MCTASVRVVVLVLLILRCIGSVKIRHRHGLLRYQLPPNTGLFPSVFNLATKSSITANATCGSSGREEFCRLGAGDTGGPGGSGRGGRCGVCDANSPDPGKRHPVENLVDGTNKWWQSPSLNEGMGFEQVTITVDLKQVYQVVDVIVKSGPAPRPGSWILERSIDGVTYQPWQYYVINDDDCLQVYGIPASPGKPKYVTDTDVICTSYFSKLYPLENGEIHTSLFHGRPGANDSSPELLAFTKARYVRLRFLKHRATAAVAAARHGGLGAQPLAKRLYYAIRDITIGGQCVCNGHARSCRHNVQSGHPECQCHHGTCGPHCERCCPLMNQVAWGAGSSRDARVCESCQCYGHAESCIYDEQVQAKGLSIDTLGRKRGGGVCVNCTHFTTGINCDRCLPGYYRPLDVPPDAPEPCLPCECDEQGSIICREDGTCVCRDGFSGHRCDRCAPGFASFPQCTQCQCDSRGTVLFGDCEKDCLCKANVQGARCDICKEGHFALRRDNIEGCSTCYCSGVANVCESAFIVREKVETLQDWLVSDITGSQTVKPTLDTDTNWLSVGNYELPGIEAYYWLAPQAYTGNQLESYGSSMVFHIHWVVMRGDTSGKPTTGPNLILVGDNGLRIAYDDATYTVTNATINITLKEDKWYHIPFGVRDIVTRLRRTEYRGDPVTRFQFMSILSSVKHVLLRAKFHTDQIEGSLQQAAIVSDGLGAEVEKCACPTGYTGLSCQTCDYGYVQVLMNTTAHVEQGLCVKCPCNNHSPSCTAFTSNTCSCQHNTVGETCERCAPGYYGNPLAGTSGDCKKCACPLLEETNNFSPSCQLDNSEGGEEYVCTQCPIGYTGDHCEICDYGYWGTPTLPGSSCQPCTCGGGPCDRRTGQCLSCRGNTAGWRCERCKPGHWGDAAEANCHPCECDPIGAVSNDCDEKTGQCECKEKVTGRMCDRCEVGFGNLTADCTPCSCHTIGAVSNTCDPVSGVCECKPGVEGFRCDACQHLHYGFSKDGCKGCACNLSGSELPTCDIVTGQCRCKPHVIGRNCDSCERGYWGIDSGKGCFKCDCDDLGSVDSTCDQRTKQCICKPGIGGIRCDECLPGYFGFSNQGCKPCEYCKKPGHICDPDTGRCVCPPNSRGETCERCAPNCYGYQTGIGCKICNCSPHGSDKKQCDLRNGQCECKIGYTGPQCDKCAFGYYGYPRCRKCDCDRAGTEAGNCHTSGLCSCGDDGQCACKANVIGKKCNECRDGTFGLHLDNPGGCTQCFCFGRTAHCSESNLTIGHVRLNTSREFEIDYIFKKQYAPMYNQPFQKYLSKENDLLIIPGVYDDIMKVQVDNQIDQAIYWRLPVEFLGDKILSYGGYLRFVTETIGGTTTLPYNKYPLIQLRGNDKIILEHYQLLPNMNNKHEIRFHESLWRWKNQQHSYVSRDLLMVALQKVQHILIRANSALNFNKVVLHNVTLDTAIQLPGSPPPLAKGVELCECPRQYNSSSCQNPSIGFYRWYNPDLVNGTIIINLIGEAKPCECNGRSDVCDTETGHCLNCTENTTGSNCQYCSEGYYGNPLHGKCKPCPCPSKDRNFSRKCHRLHHGGFKCICKTGYSGPKCDSCKSGYFGNPEEEGGSCNPCNCNKFGSASDECDEKTGQCNCKPGMSGKDCSVCEKTRHVLQIGGCKPCDNCTQWLLNDLDRMSTDLDKTFSDYILYDRIRRLYDKLNEMSNRTVMLQKDLDDYKLLQHKIRQHSIDHLINQEDQARRMKNHDLIERSDQHCKEIKQINSEIDNLFNNIDSMTEDLQKNIKDLQNFGTSHVEVKNAVKQGRKILDEIKNIPTYHPDLLEKRKYCSKISSNIKNIDTIYNHNYNDISMDLEDFKKRLNDMKNIISKNQNTLNQHDETSADVRERIEGLKEQINELSGLNLESSNETQELLNKAKELLKKAQTNHQKLEDSTEFDNLFSQLEKGKYGDVNIPQLRKLVENAKKHAKELERRADIIKKSFNISHEADLALKASRVYQEIIDILEAARESAIMADNTINDANKKINPRGKSSLQDSALEAVEKSRDIIEEADVLRTDVEDLEEQKELLNISISGSQNTLWRTGLKDNLLNSNIHNLTFTKKDIIGIMHQANAISNKMKEIYKNSNKIKDDIQYKLRPQLDALKQAGEHDISLGEEKVSEVERNMKNSMDILISLETNNHIRKTNLTKWNDTISRKLDELKSRILKAKQAADGVRVSLTNAQNAICTRSYKPYNVGPTTTNRLSLILSLNNTDTDRNTSLFYIQTISKDFMALQLINKQIQYLWNLGGDTGITKLKLPPNTNNDKWYKIQIERIANVTKMTVFNKETENKPSEVKGAASSDFTRFDLGPYDKIWVGGAIVNNDNDDVQSTDSYQLLTGTGVNGCLSDVVFDGKPIGLWNFVNSTDVSSCTLCNKEVLTVKTDNCCYFNGRGYSVMPRDDSSIYRATTTSIRFDFTTYDENALLFLAVDIENGRFVSISLKNGRIQFHIEYGGKSVLILTTKEKYNNGSKTTVTTSRQYNRKIGEKALLEVNKESIRGTPMNMPEKNSFPNLIDASYYVGGVPPDFFLKTNGTTKTLHTHASFLGCIEEIDIDGTRYSPLDEKHSERFGVEPSCLNKLHTIAGFESTGYIEMPEQTLNPGSSFGFVFRSQQKDALLLESINPNQINNYYTVSIMNGKLEVVINTGKKIVTLTSNSSMNVNDGYYHVISIKVFKKSVKLRIDDELHDENQTDFKNLNIVGNIYLGGAPENLSNTIKIPTSENLTGTIKDFIFDERLIPFNELLNFEKVKVGRPGPLPDVTPEVSTLMMRGRTVTVPKPPPQCHRIPNYSLEAGAVKFGDASNSYVQHSFKSNNFWNKDYIIELEFRTFYLNGLIFVSPGIKEKNRHYISLTLSEYSLSLVVKGKRKREIILQKKFDDGQWHHITIQNVKKKLTLTVDGQSDTKKVPKKINLASMIYIGGLPANGSHLPETFVTKLHPFRGCIRNLKVNNQHQDLIKDISNHNNVGQCFPRVEIGSYFAGDAFAVFKYFFEVNTHLELQFEFRTSEQNGILLSISDPESSHGLSLELYNGAVLMMGNMGNNGPSKVTTNLSTEYSLCDNKWHKVSALYYKEEMTVNVDGVVRTSIAINSTFMDSKIESPLYIGGLPDDAPLGTLHTRENFKGCIRNVEIQRKIIDWTDMDELQNILLNSCPVIDS